jgi:hypothetical protein
MVRSGGIGVRFLKVIQEFSQTAWISKKEPAHHRLKSCGLSVKGGVLVPGSPSCPVASAPHQALFAGSKVGLEPFQGRCLGFRPHLGHHLVVEIGGSAGGLAALQPLVQLPDGVAQPGQLQDVELLPGSQGRQGGQPETRSWSGVQ